VKKEIYNPKKRAKKRQVVTEDGSVTLYSSEFDECYHSVKDGALEESLKKHVEIAFELTKDKEELTILDICFGLGYNTLTTLYYLKRESLNKRVKIISPEFDRELIKSLKSFPYPEEFEDFRDIIEALSDSGEYRDENLEIKILFGDAREELPKIEERVDIVYQDAFSPKKNPLLWTREYFATIKKISAKDVVVTTYSVATPVRLSMWEEGFLIYEYPQSSVRRGSVASLSTLNLPAVDMELKLQRNPEAKSLRDSDFL
jgi:tRNA U34 5-methylaminomethyl-2-thiouridine-forming methyltransferase MnmC